MRKSLRGEALGCQLSARGASAAAGRASGGADINNNRRPTNSASSVPSESLIAPSRCEPVVHLDTRSGTSRTPSSSPPVLHPEGDINVIRDFSGSVRPPAASTGHFSPPRLILEIPPPYVSPYVATLPHVAPGAPTDQRWGGDRLLINAHFPWVDGDNIDIPDEAYLAPIYSPLSPASASSPTVSHDVRPASVSVGIQVGPPLTETTCVGTDVDLKV